MSSENVFIGIYSCPHCRADLETGFDEWQGWRRCPTCGLPSLPPEPTEASFLRQPATRAIIVNDSVLLAESPENVADGEPAAAAIAGRASHIGPARLVFRTGLLVSLGLMLIFYLDRNTMNATIFAILAVVFFLTLLRLSGSRSPAP